MPCSAKPVNNRFTDLRISLRLAYEGQSDALSKEPKNPEPAWKRFSAVARDGFNVLVRLPPESADPASILRTAGFRLFFRIAGRGDYREVAPNHIEPFL